MKQILLVEDEVIARESLKVWLTDHGYTVNTAKNGYQALESIAEEDFILVILDLNLPDIDGIEVLKRAKKEKPSIKGLIITACPSVRTAAEALKEGAIDYLIKPLVLDDLEDLLRETPGLERENIKPETLAEERVDRDNFTGGKNWELKYSFWKGKTPCWEMCHCPGEIREKCPASKHESIPCWEIEGTLCKPEGCGEVSGRETGFCKICPVYKKWGEGKDIKANLFNKRVNRETSTARRLKGAKR